MVGVLKSEKVHLIVFSVFTAHSETRLRYQYSPLLLWSYMCYSGIGEGKKEEREMVSCFLQTTKMPLLYITYPTPKNIPNSV